MPKGINEWAREIHENALKHGWWEDYLHSTGPAARALLMEKILLVHNEVSEMVEEFRENKPAFYETVEGKPEGWGIELVDVLIRLLDLSVVLELNVEDMLSIKHEFNLNRPYKHGKLF